MELTLRTSIGLNISVLAAHTRSRPLIGGLALRYCLPRGALLPHRYEARVAASGPQVCARMARGRRQLQTRVVSIL